jgi:hypothetical protein
VNEKITTTKTKRFDNQYDIFWRTPSNLKRLKPAPVSFCMPTSGISSSWETDPLNEIIWVT